MKHKKAIIILIVFGVLLFGIYACGKVMMNEALSMEPPHGGFSTSEPNNNSAPILNTIVFTGKVIPEEELNINESTSLTRNKIYVAENEIVKKGGILVDYLGKDTINDKIVILKNEIKALEDEQGTFVNKINDFKEGLNVATDSTNIYYLKQDLSKAENNLSQNKIEIENKRLEIAKLEKSRDDYVILANFDGFVYQINENQSFNAMNATSASPFMIVYSTEKVIKIEVNEYELKYMTLDKTVDVEIEGLKKTYQAKISKIDQIPNNFQTSEDSKYNVEITIDQEVPYGFNAIVTVSTK